VTRIFTNEDVCDDLFATIDFSRGEIDRRIAIKNPKETLTS
jgi:hypothetical protein